MHSYFYHLIKDADQFLRTLLPPVKRIASRPSPADQVEDFPMNREEKRHVAGLMRINHAGEVAAQALYQAQARIAQSDSIKMHMQEAAVEETDHLAWCEQRLAELGSQPSLLNPIWYGGSFLIGLVAGIGGDTLSLGFVAETEKQVSSHLNQHLQKLPMHDKKTRTILEQMQQDEEHHAKTAREAGAMDLPSPVKIMMHLISKIMTKSSYYI